MSPQPSNKGPRPLRLAGWLLWIGVLVGGVALWLLLPRPGAQQVEAIPEYGSLPAFDLVDERGQAFGRAQLQDKVHVFAFIFTRCASLCPLITQRMVQVQSKLAEHKLDAGLISVSVDPEYDTPERLKAYGAKHGSDPARWRYLTGPIADVHALVVGGFGTAIERIEAPASQPASAAAAGAQTQAASAAAPDQRGEMIDISHTSRLVVVDGQARIRGYFDSNSQGVAETVDRVRALVAARARGGA